jgi:eukaryotic-like serine/threonine-protein kinase
MANGDSALNHVRRLARFGVFELDTDTGELRKHGIRIKLQGQPFQVLKALVDEPGSVVTREELRSRLWPGHTFVDFENGLNTAINRARVALGDSSGSPRFIETLARTGYRFIAPVERIESPAEPPKRIEPPSPDPAIRDRTSRRPVIWIAAALALFASIAVAYRTAIKEQPREATLRQVTFRRGIIGGARFAPRGDAVIYTAQWESDPQTTFLTSIFSPESRPLGFEKDNLAAISSKGQLALLTFSGTMNIGGGTLSRVSINGGSPLQLDSHIMSADWSPDGERLAVVRSVNGSNQLEFPTGKVLYRTSGWLSGMRVSRDQVSVAFIEHPVRHDNAGSIRLVNVSGSVRTLTGPWSSAAGLSWHPATGEIWFTAARKGGLRSLWACSASGALREIRQAPGVMTLRDISPAGHVLISRDTARLEMAGKLRNEHNERSLSALDWSRVQDISADGSLVLFDESGEGAGDPSLYISRASGGGSVRIGEGRAMGFSPDNTEVLALDGAGEHLRLLSLTGAAPRTLPSAGLTYQWARFFPDGRRLLVLGSEAGKPLSLYVQPLTGSAPPAALAAESMVRNTAISPDGTRVAVLLPDGRLVLYSTSGGRPITIPAAEPLAPIHWSRDGEWLFVQHLRSYREVPTRVSKVNIRSGLIQPWREFAPADRIGVHSVTGIVISDDERSYVYSYRRFQSELYIASGWR